jgi:hypothetical protein
MKILKATIALIILIITGINLLGYGHMYKYLLVLYAVFIPSFYLIILKPEIKLINREYLKALKLNLILFMVAMFVCIAFQFKIFNSNLNTVSTSYKKILYVLEICYYVEIMTTVLIVFLFQLGKVKNKL